MKILFSILSILLLLQSAISEETRPNVLLICVDDLRPELKCFGKDYIRSPHIDRLASEGRIFRSHYVQAPTCGASRFTLLTGTYGPGSNNALFDRAKKIVNPSLPAWFRQHGYTTVSVGKVSHHPGGFGGPDWNNPAILEMPNSWDRHLLPAGPWQHPRGWMHGLANGEIRKNAKDMDLFQAYDGDDRAYPDGISVDEALHQIEILEAGISDKPFFLAAGILRPHLPFGAPRKYLDLYDGVELPPIPHPEKPEGKNTWHKSGEFMKYNRWKRDPNSDAEFADEVRRHYAACVSYADAQVGKLLDKLDELKLRSNTIVVLWGDHGWHLGEHAVWGKHTLYEESLLSPLIISAPNSARPGEATDSMVETLDIFPTLCDLAELDKPDFLQGTSLLPILKDPSAKGHPAIAYQSNIQTIRTDTHRLIRHKAFAELYDHTTPEKETRNVAEEFPDLVENLGRMLDEKLGSER